MGAAIAQRINTGEQIASIGITNKPEKLVAFPAPCRSTTDFAGQFHPNTSFIRHQHGLRERTDGQRHPRA